MNTKTFLFIVAGMAIIFGLSITISHFSHPAVGAMFGIMTLLAVCAVAGINYENNNP